jgi:1,2-diacylglycerol 3-alpha-glucosyltransferase
MKIGIFSDRYLPQTDGISISIETFRVELEKLGHEVYVFAPKPSLSYKERSQRVIRFPAVKGLFFDDWLTSFFFPPQVIRQIDKLNLDIIHYQTPSQIGLMGLYYGLQKHLPIVTTYHTDLYEYVKHYPPVLPGTIALSLLTPMITRGKLDEFRQAFSSIKPERSVDIWNQKIVVRGITLIHNHCDLVITPSAKFEKQLRGWKTKARIATLPTGVDKITTKPQAIEHIRKKYKLDPSDKIILLVCRIGTEKNIGLLIKAFDIIGNRVPNAKLVIIGPGDDLEHFKNMAAHTAYPDRIIFTGYIPYNDLGAFYDTARVFAFPSLA